MQWYNDYKVQFQGTTHAKTSKFIFNTCEHIQHLCTKYIYYIIIYIYILLPCTVNRYTFPFNPYNVGYQINVKGMRAK